MVLLSRWVMPWESDAVVITLDHYAAAATNVNFNSLIVML